MAISIDAGAEPIPGYKLLHRLGQGGYGDVWKVEAPGGLHKAIKFVYGNLNKKKADQPHLARQELNALKRIQSVRHPFILSLERYDIIDGQLLIVMELADRNLWDRYKECKKPGIPRDELLRYLDEAAEALDLMAEQHGLQHLDIKPENLFLVQNHVKVADFGLAKDLEGFQNEAEAGVTPDYAAPELFAGGMSRHCDQYSLAIVFMELLTGKRPFPGRTMKELKQQHTETKPDLAKLSPADQIIIGQALAKQPEARYPSCMDLVRALRHSTARTVSTRDESPRPRTVPLTEVNIDVTCPKCQATGNVPVSLRGKQVSCRHCKKPFLVPEPPALEIPDDIHLEAEDAESKAPATAKPRTSGLVNTTCPVCGQQGTLPGKLVGKKIRCKKCKKSFVVKVSEGPEVTEKKTV